MAGRGVSGRSTRRVTEMRCKMSGCGRRSIGSNDSWMLRGVPAIAKRRRLPSRRSGIQRPGRKAGPARPARRRVPAHVDDHYDAPLPATCPACQAPVIETGVATQYQEELPVACVRVRAFHIHVGRCQGCGQRVQGATRSKRPMHSAPRPRSSGRRRPRSGWSSISSSACRLGRSRPCCSSSMT